MLLTRHRQHLFVVGDATCCDADLALEEYEASAAAFIDTPDYAPNDTSDDVPDKNNQEQIGRKTYPASHDTQP